MPSHQPAAKAVKAKLQPASAARGVLAQVQPSTAATAPRIGACACGGSCPRCTTAQRVLGSLRLSQPGDAQEREADAIASQPNRVVAAAAQAPQSMPSVGAAAPGTGRALDPATRGSMEARLGAAFDDVRLHHDAAAAEAAASLQARAYTVGPHIVFGAGQYAPRSSAGQHLLTHELAHVVQQRGSGLQVQRTPDFGDPYKSKDGEVRSHLQKTYDVYKAELPAMKASSEAAGAKHKLDPKDPITTAELLEVYKGVAKDIESGKVKQELFDAYVTRLNESFRTFQVDTVEAQASFIANAWRESDQFRFMTETEKAVSTNKPYQDKPEDVHLFKGYLECAAKRSAEVKQGLKPTDDKNCPNVIDYEKGGSINPTGDWGQSFIGRGPIQVTHRHSYVQVLAVMEKRAEEMESADKDSAEAKKVRAAITAIAADPKQAANPEYSFLFSVAFMKMPDEHEDRATGDAKAARGQVTSWMGQQPADAKADKDQAYIKAHEVLMRKFDAQTARYGYGVEGDPINDEQGLGPRATRVRPGPVRATSITPR